MNRYEDLIVDFMIGETPKEKYEYALKMHMKIGELKGRIEHLKLQFEWIDLNLQQGLGIPKSAIEAILNSFEKTEERGQKIKQKDY